MSNRIEFYKNRSIGDRFSVAIDFLKQNWKVLYKNILIGGLPLALIMSFLLARQQTFLRPTITGISTFSGTTDVLLNTGLYYVFNFLAMLYMYSMTGAVLLHYDRNQLTESTGWNNLKNTFFNFAGKYFLISLIVFIPVMIVVGIIAVAFNFAMTGISLNNSFAIGMILFILLFVVAILALVPTLTIIYFPAFYSGKSVLDSVKVAFKLGFKNWGSLFVAIILTFIVLGIVYMIFYGPLQVVSLLSVIGRINVSLIIYFFLAILTAIGLVLVYPITVVIFSFQYFSIVEKEEGVSLQSQVSEFENL